MFRALQCSSSGARDYDVVYQHTANQERHNQCGKQHHSRELLMMDIVMLETC
jgi:hypothetical protein